MDETDDDMVWNGSEENGNEALAVKMETVTLVGKIDRIRHALYIKSMKLK